MGVGVVEHGGERLLEPTGHGLLVGRQVVPSLDARVAGGQVGSGRDDAHGELAFVDMLAGDVPAIVESAPPLFEVVVGCLMWGVGGPKGQVEEKGALGHHRVLSPHQVDSVVHQIFGDVVSLLGRAGLVNEAVVLVELGVELVGLALHEAVVAVEAPLERPVAKRSDR